MLIGNTYAGENQTKYAKSCLYFEFLDCDSRNGCEGGCITTTQVRGKEDRGIVCCQTLNKIAC